MILCACNNLVVYVLLVLLCECIHNALTTTIIRVVMLCVLSFVYACRCCVLPGPHPHCVSDSRSVVMP